MITPDELEILRKPEVQGYIVGTLKYVVPGDVLFYIETEQTFTVGKVNETEFQIIPDLQGYEWQLKEHLRFFLRIPDCISRDSERPERGLWGCLKPFISGGMNYYPYMDATAMSDQVIVGFKCGCASIIHWIGTPRLALLKALEWQIRRK